MTKSILLSVRPRYCELIASGKKKVELRKKEEGTTSLLR